MSRRKKKAFSYQLWYTIFSQNMNLGKCLRRYFIFKSTVLNFINLTYLKKILRVVLLKTYFFNCCSINTIVLFFSTRFLKEQKLKLIQTYISPSIVTKSETSLHEGENQKAENFVFFTST